MFKNIMAKKEIIGSAKHDQNYIPWISIGFKIEYQSIFVELKQESKIRNIRRVNMLWIFTNIYTEYFFWYF